VLEGAATDAEQGMRVLVTGTQQHPQQQQCTNTKLVIYFYNVGDFNINTIKEGTADTRRLKHILNR
jgi:hypothetical protein